MRSCPTRWKTTLCTETPKGNLESACITRSGFHTVANMIVHSLFCMLSSERFAMSIVFLEVAQIGQKMRDPFRNHTDKHWSNVVGLRRAMGRSTTIRDYQNMHYAHEFAIVRTTRQASVLTGSNQPDLPRQKKYSYSAHPTCWPTPPPVPPETKARNQRRESQKIQVTNNYQRTSITHASRIQSNARRQPV